MITASKTVDATLTLIERFSSAETVRCVILCNRNAASKDLTLWLVPKDGVLGDEHQVLSAVEIYGNETIILELYDIKLGNQEAIWAQGSAGATFSITVMVN